MTCLQRVLSTAMRSGGEFAEVYAEDKRSTSAGLDDGRVEQVTSGRDRGAGIRVVAGETTGFAHTSDLSEAGLRAAAEAAAAAASQGGGGTRTVALDRVDDDRATTRSSGSPTRSPRPTRSSCCARIDDAARSAGAEIVQVSAGYADAASGCWSPTATACSPTTRSSACLLRISTVADGDTGMQTGFHSMGHTIGFEVFDTVDVDELARDAARQAITKLKARPAPSGSMPVVIKHGTGGVLFHEACGHGLEADHVAKGASVYTRQDRRARRLAARHRRRRRHDGRRVGHARRSTTRATPRSATCSSRTAC